MTTRLILNYLLAALILGFFTWKAIPVIDYFTGKTIHWKQEAPLHDGRMLIVDRISKLSPSNPFDLSMRMEIKQRLSFEHPDTGKELSWTIPAGLHPVMIDFVNGTPYFLLNTAMAGDYSKWGCPNPPYLAYRFQGGKWKYIAFDEFPNSLVMLNLITDSKSAMHGPGELPDKTYVPSAVVTDFWRQVLGQSENQPTYKFMHENEARRFNREKLRPSVLTARCGVGVLVAMKRESEIDEEARQKHQEENIRWQKLPLDVRIDSQKRLEKMRKEIEERLQ